MINETYDSHHLIEYHLCYYINSNPSKETIKKTRDNVDVLITKKNIKTSMINTPVSKIISSESKHIDFIDYNGYLNVDKQIELSMCYLRLFTNFYELKHVDVNGKLVIYIYASNQVYITSNNEDSLIQVRAITLNEAVDYIFNILSK